MPKRCLLFLFLLCVVGSAAAQSPVDDYYPYAETEERTPMLVPDSALFYRAVQSGADLYARVADFNLPPVARARRGQSFRAEVASFEKLNIAYRYFSALRSLGTEERFYPGLAAGLGVEGGAGGLRAFAFSEGASLLPYYASVRFSGRNYLLGAKCSASGEWGSGWSYAAALDARTGRDLLSEGIFTNAMTAALRLGKHLGDGHQIALLVVVPPSARGTRLSSTEETFALTGDRLYNPAWGFQNGKVRNSRVRRETVPLAVVSYRGPFFAATTLSAALGVEAGVSSYSMLGWYNARTPMPDNYRYLPSYTADRETEAAWRADDARYTQINWDGMIASNRMADGHAVYALEERAERLCNLHFNATFTTDLSPGLRLEYGLSFRREASRSYKQMRDLLGAEYITDIDQFLVDDDTYGTLLQNDLRRPDRIIHQGDRFGYDYTLTTCDLNLRVAASYRADRLRADVVAVVGSAWVLRRGHMEKELFPGSQSFGPSRQLRFAPYTFRLSVGWAFSPRSYLAAVAVAGASAPDPMALFCQPLYNNRTVDDPVPERFFGGELNYRFTSAMVELQCTAFVTTTLDGMAARRYFDDMAGVYANLQTGGLGRLALGVEAAAELRLSYRWRLSLAASAGRYRFIRNPRVTVLSDVDNTAIDTRAESFMGGCTTGGSPQLTACAGINYFGPRGWGFRFSAGYAGERYVEPEPLRRTERIARQGGVTAEAFESFTSQTQLDDAFTADASLFKSFYFEHSRLTVSLLVRNLVGSRDMPYNGYESLRVRRQGVGDAIFRAPHAMRYTYAYPRSFYLTVSYRF